MTKIREIIDSYNGEADFSKTKKEMIFSIYEQIMLIFISTFFVVILGSKSLDKTNLITCLVLDSALIANFVYAILILLDTSKSVFILLDFKKKQ